MSEIIKPTVLLVEPDPSLRRLISLGLQCRGMIVIEALAHSDLLTTVEAHCPNIVVMDIDTPASSDWTSLTTIQLQPALATLPVVFLSWECVVPWVDLYNDPIPHPPQMICLPKPFDARALYATIEQLLKSHAPAPVATSVSALLPTRSTTPAPGLWPLVTAIGLLLAFIGFMGQMLLIVLGLLIVLVGLLWWTLGTRPESPALSL